MKIHFLALKYAVSAMAVLPLPSAYAINPICPPGVYIADPEARQMPDGRVYVYGSRDEPGGTWCSRSYNVLTSRDLKSWTVDQMSFATSGPAKQTDYTDSILYAPDCIHRDGKYFLYYCLSSGGEDEGVAVADSPSGPFKNGRKFTGITGIDPAVLVDDDGQAYLYWGQGNAKCAKLTKDMTEIVPGSIKENVIYHNNSPYSDDPAVTAKTDDFWFNEGASIRKRKGIYYLVFAQGGRHTRGKCACLAYATATSPTGPFKYRGVIIDNSTSQPNLINNHGCIAELNGKWYVFYHRPTSGGPQMRKACMEPITFNANGSINEVPMTTQGASGPLNPFDRMDAARACLITGNARSQERRPAWDTIVDSLTNIKDGDTAGWRYFDFAGKNASQFTCKTWGKNLAGKIEIHLDKADGELIATCDIAPAAENTSYAIHTCTVKPVTGTHGLVFVFKGATPDTARPDLFNLEWFQFDGNPSTR